MLLIDTGFVLIQNVTFIHRKNHLCAMLFGMGIARL